MSEIEANLQRVRERIARAAERAGRRAQDVLLVGVSKTVDVERIRQAIAAGIPALGENRVQEARGKVDELGRPVPWHLVGHLQTNKARDAVDLFDVTHSLDRLDLARELDKRAHARGRPVSALVEVNVGGEASKGGVAPDELGRLLEAVAALTHVKVRGLMAIPPEAKDPEDARVWFRALRKLGELRCPTAAAADGAGGAMTIKGRTVGFVGAGNMGEALIKGLVVANVVPA